ncbi:MAG: OmpH family outer membrane protein [Puniceicoccaceae bacterium]
MKKLLMPLIALGAFVFNPAMAEVTIVTVSMSELFEGYYKQTQANERLQSVQDTYVAERDAKAKALQELADQARAVQEELQNPVLSDESKKEKEANLQAIAENIRQEQMLAEQWNQQQVQGLQRQQNDIRTNLIKEITDVVKEMALKDFAADLVLDTSDILGGGVPAVLYSNTEMDITAKVLVRLNADAPNN